MSSVIENWIFFIFFFNPALHTDGLLSHEIRSIQLGDQSVKFYTMKCIKKKHAGSEPIKGIPSPTKTKPSKQ